jgi:hypothetical protein
MSQSTLPRPLYAVAGAGDLVAEQLRKLADRAPEIQDRVQRSLNDLPADLRQISRELPRDLTNFATDLPSYAAQLQSRARTLDGDKVADSVKRNVETASEKAQDVYVTLVERGQKVVDGDDTPTPPKAEGKAPAQAGAAVARKTAARTTAKKTPTKKATRPAKNADS